MSRESEALAAIRTGLSFEDAARISGLTHEEVRKAWAADAAGAVVDGPHGAEFVAVPEPEKVPFVWRIATASGQMILGFGTDGTIKGPENPDEATRVFIAGLGDAWGQAVEAAASARIEEECREACRRAFEAGMAEGRAPTGGAAG